MRYQTLLRKLAECGYEFKREYGVDKVTSPEPRPLIEITHRYPGKKQDAIHTSIGYVTKLDVSGQPPEEIHLYWCTRRIEGKEGTVHYVGSDWSQLRHIVKCSPASKNGK